MIDTYNKETVSSSISKLFKISKDELEIYVSNYSDITYDGFVEYLKEIDKIGKVKLDYAYIWHIISTTDIDFVLRNGLWNLCEVVKNSNPIKDVLDEYNIDVNTSEEYPIISGANFAYNLNKFNEFDYMKQQKLKIFRTRFSSDKGISGFFFREKAEYDKNVDHIIAMPEILHDFREKLGLPLELERNWIANSKTYILKIKCEINSLDVYSEDVDVERNVRVKYVTECLKYLKTGSNRMIFTFPDIKVHSENIVKKIEVDRECSTYYRNHFA